MSVFSIGNNETINSTRELTYDRKISLEARYVELMKLEGKEVSFDLLMVRCQQHCCSMEMELGSAGHPAHLVEEVSTL